MARLGRRYPIARVDAQQPIQFFLAAGNGGSATTSWTDTIPANATAAVLVSTGGGTVSSPSVTIGGVAMNLTSVSGGYVGTLLLSGTGLPGTSQSVVLTGMPTTGSSGVAGIVYYQNISGVGTISSGTGTTGSGFVVNAGSAAQTLFVNAVQGPGFGGFTVFGQRLRFTVGQIYPVSAAFAICDAFGYSPVNFYYGWTGVSYTYYSVIIPLTTLYAPPGFLRASNSYYFQQPPTLPQSVQNVNM